ncbi:nitrogen regulation protein NR(II) [Roseateles sp. BYS180W]|uniref:histidine kinase n=1 Tax=Roseateles rivi TaxID=3299028 RepID=A0ABW7FWV1_9BURK
MSRAPNPHELRVNPETPSATPRALWWVPLALSLLFVGAILVWARAMDRLEHEQARETLITDALSLEAQLRSRLEHENQQLALLAQQLGRAQRQGQPIAAQAFAALPTVQEGLQRLWISVTWLDAQHRVRASAPAGAPKPENTDGLSLHLSAPIDGSGQLVLRYAPLQLLKRGVPWWLARKYEVQVVDSAGQVLASTLEQRNLDPREAQRHRTAQTQGLSYRLAFPGPLLNELEASPTFDDAMLELQQREPLPRTLRPLALVLIAGFVVLLALSSVMLRQRWHQLLQAEAKGRTEAAWRAAMEDSALVALRARDLQGRLLYVNRTLCDMVGYSAEELLACRGPMPYWLAEDHEATLQRLQRILQGQAPREGYEAHWRHRQGQVLDVMVFESPLVDAQGQHVGWMGSIVDITERKRLQQREARQTELQAHHARLTMLGEIAATLAHELNQPLTAIASYNAGVQNSLQQLGVSDARVLQAVQRIGERAQQAGQVVQRIRAYLTRREPQREPCHLPRIVEHASALLRGEFTRLRIDFQVHQQAPLPELQGDTVLLEQVLINLLRNAADALQERPMPRRIQVWLQALPDGGVGVQVQDNGPGLQGRAGELLFEPFYSTKAEGMGMGLAICRSILESHGARLQASEAPGGGALMQFDLPPAPTSTPPP